MVIVLASISWRIGFQQYIYAKGYFINDIAGLAVGSGMEYLSIVYVWGHRLGLYWGRESQVWVFVSKPMSLSIVTTLVTIPSVKESAMAKGGLAQ